MAITEVLGAGMSAAGGVARDRGGSFRLAMKTEWNVMLGSRRSTEKERSRAVEEWYRGSM